jgi:nuclear pore complex protein Nup133
MSVLDETNTVCLQSIYDSALGIRNNYYGPVYGLSLDDYPKKEPWTSKIDLMQAFEAQYEITRKVPNPKAVVKNQLVCLVESLCSMYEGRVRWLQSRGPEEKQETDTMEKKYIEKRNNWLETLVRIDYKDAAIKIAEQYHIYRSLAEIMVQDWKDARTAHEEEIASAIKERLHIYMDKFGYQFAYTLFQYLVEVGQLKVLLTEFPAFDDYLEKYLSTGKHGKISWVHDISKRDYAKASRTLAHVGLYSEEFNSNKKLQLSLAKLTALACDEQNLVQEVDKQIDIVQIQDSLVSQISARIGDKPTEYEIYTDPLKTSKLHKPFIPVLQRGLLRIVQKRALGIDELIDTLTLLPSSREQAHNFYRAFKLLSLSGAETDLHSRLNEKIIWRRLILVDDWSAIVNTKQKSDKKMREITENTVLYRTLLLIAEDEILSSFGSQILEDPKGLIDLTSSSDWIANRYSFADERLQLGIAESFDLETTKIESLINDFGLASWTKGIYSRIAGNFRMEI